MATLKDIAQQVMDKYYQDYKSDEDFHDLEDFMSIVVAAYNKLIVDEYKENKRENKLILGFSMVDLSPDWLKTATVAVQKDPETDYLVAQLPERIFSFPFDSVGHGVQVVTSVSKSHYKDFIRISVNDVWQLHLLPVTSKAFFVVGKDRIRFVDTDKVKVGQQVRIQYAPQLDSSSEDGEIQEGKVLPVFLTALQLFIAARDGTVIDMLNDSNPNKDPKAQMEKSVI